ncbi:MAG: WYL domain-containing protein, partial [Spirochaetales bacterium]|nr:WYL domain-containing protein [Spirochaetales bacterium]
DFCSRDRFSSDGEEHYIVRFPFIENDYHYHILTGFGEKCECLEPPSVRGEMRRRIQEMGALYAT